MKSMHIGSPATIDNLYMSDTEAPAPQAGEIKVRIRANSLNFRDNLVACGFFPVDEGLIPLSDAAGEIVVMGSGVSGFSVGDKVVSLFHPNWVGGHMERPQLNMSPGGPANGYACEYATRPVNHFCLAPSHLTYAEAATLPCAGLTAWRAVVTDAQTKPGDTVLIQGTGGVSLFALQFAKACGATVIATSSNAEKLTRLKQLGADYVINYKENPNWGEQAAALSNGVGVDLVVEVGGPNTMAQSCVAARTGGHIAIIGAVAGFDIDTMPFAIVQAKRLRLQGVTLGSHEDQANMIRAIEYHAIKPVLDRHFALDDLAAAFKALQNSQHIGNIVVDI